MQGRTMISFKVFSFWLYAGQRLKRKEGKHFGQRGKMKEEALKVSFPFVLGSREKRRELREREGRELREREREQILGSIFFCFIFLKV